VQGSNHRWTRDTHKTHLYTVWAARTWGFEIIGFNALPFKLSEIAVDTYLARELNLQAECSSLRVPASGPCSFFLKDLLPRKYVQDVRGQITKLFLKPI